MTLINQTILMSDAAAFALDQPINPYYHQKTVDIKKAATEHHTIRTLMIKAGIKVIKVPSPTGCQDGIYTANWALVRGDTAVLANLPNARCDEEDYAKAVLEALGKKVINVPKNLKFSGQGDALACGNLLFCGQGYRSDVKAQEFAAKTLGYERIQLQTIPKLDKYGQAAINSTSGWPDSYFYDLDLALAIIKAPNKKQRGLIAYCPDAFTKESQAVLDAMDQIDKIKVCLNEAKSAFATNLVSTGETVIMSKKAPKLADELKKHGLKVHTPRVTEIAKGGGYIRCITLTID